MKLPALLMAAAPEPSFWLPPQVSTSAGDVDRMFDFILWLSIFFLVLITGLMLYFVWKYRARKGHAPMPSPSHNVKLELVWSVVPLLLVLYIFYEGFVGYLDLRTPPGNGYSVGVTAQKWNWQFAYPNGYIDASLHVPVNTPVNLTMASEDVLHSLFIPAFRVKMDVVPGRYTEMWFEATEPGTYPLYCTEYCGTKHSSMVAEVIVHPEGEFEPWLEEASDFVERLPPVEAGEMLYKTRGCTQCHTIDGKDGIGPSFTKILIGQSRPLKDGSTVVYDKEYIRESIVEPQTKIAAGYESVMPTYQGRLKTKEIDVIFEYIKSLNP